MNPAYFLLLLSPPLGAGEVVVAGPFRSVAGQAWTAGSDLGQDWQPGSIAAQDYSAGSEEGQSI